MDTGYIKLWRKLMRSDMYLSLTSVQRDVMIQCLMMANHAPKKWEWQGKVFKCEPGQFVTSLDSLRKNCGAGVTIMMVRTALSKLILWNFLTSEGTKTGRLITIINWDAYQNCPGKDNKEDNRIITKRQQSSNKAVTTNKNDKELKELKELIHIPEWLSEEAWDSFLEMRLIKKKRPTEKALKIIIGKLTEWRSKGHDPTEILNNATVNSWTDVYEPKPQGASHGSNQGHSQTTRTPAGGVRGDADKYANTANRFSEDSDGDSGGTV